MNLKDFRLLKTLVPTIFATAFALTSACDSPSEPEPDSGSGDSTNSSGDSNDGTASSAMTTSPEDSADTGTGDSEDDSFFSGPQGDITFSVKIATSDDVFTGTFSNWHFTAAEIPDEGLVGGSFEAEIDMTSITGITNPTVLMHVNGVDYFDIMKWPTSTFSISDIAMGAQEGEYTAVASLRLRATQVDVPLVFSVTSQSPLVVEGTADPELKRSDWGMDEKDTEDKVTLEFAARLK